MLVEVGSLQFQVFLSDGITHLNRWFNFETIVMELRYHNQQSSELHKALQSRKFLFSFSSYSAHLFNAIPATHLTLKIFHSLV